MRNALCLFFLLCALPVYGHTLGELLTNAQEFDNTMVSFEAEVIGEVLKDNGGVWLNVSAQGFNIGVFVQDIEKVEAIKEFGGHRAQGDIIRVSGRFHKKCSLHHERDVHAQEVKVIRRGYKKSESVPQAKVRISLSLAIICLTLLGCYFIKVHYGTRAGENKTKS